MDEPASLHDLPLSAYNPVSKLRVRGHHVGKAAVPAVDAHAHLGRWLTEGKWAVPDVAAFVELMDACNVATVVNLDGRWGAELNANLDRYDRAHPGRFATFCHVDWSALAKPRAGALLADDLRQSVAAGARGLKVWKDLGLRVRDAHGELVLPDDRRLTPLWETAGELGVPVAIHTADPIAFFDPVDFRNERLEELLAHPDWSYADGALPRFERLMDALETVVADHRGTAFLGVHVGCCAEDLGWVDRMLTSYRNFVVDIAARVAELGRQPRATRELVLRHSTRVLFGTDGIPPGRAMYEIHFRFLQTDDEHFPYATEQPPPTGRWAISGIDLPEPILSAVYAENARRLLGQP